MDDLYKATESVGEDKLFILSELCKKYKYLEDQIEHTLKDLSVFEEALLAVSRTQIPALMNELGFSELRLSSGEKVEIKDQLKVSVANKNYFQAYKGMLEAERGNNDKIDVLFKTETVINEVTNDVLNLLLENGVEYEIKKSIHPQTLKKYCQERLDKGLSIPEGISVFQYQEAKIK